MIARRAVVLARGLGTRLRAHDPNAALSPDQQRAADAGLKALMPIGGRPFLDYVLSSLADAGLRDVALVVAPNHSAVRDHYGAHPPSRIALEYVVQPQPLGTANAVLAAERWTEGEPFLAMNADNLYPVSTLSALAALDEPGLPAFDAGDLVRTSNIPAERIAAFALLEIDSDGYLSAIVEKPAVPNLTPEGGSYRVSMNLWRFNHRIFSACRDVPQSARGEYELPEAVGFAMTRGVRFRAIPAHGPVLDLSRRGDAAELARRLDGVVPRP